MKNLIIALCTLFSFNSFAAGGISCDANYNEALETHNAETHYVTQVITKECPGGYGFVPKQWDAAEKAASQNFWVNAEKHFCIDRSQNPEFANGELRGLHFFINGEKMKSNGLDDFGTALGSALMNFLEQEHKLYALETLGLVDSGFKYPDCK